MGIVDSTGRHIVKELYDNGEGGKYIRRDNRLGVRD